MDTTYFPIPKNEFERLGSLYRLNLDYSQLHNDFKDLTYLAAKIAGTDISLVNLIDAYTLWTVGNYGMTADQTPREDTICQFTILENHYMQIPDLAKDKRFKDQPYMGDPLNLRYYFGLPLQVEEGINIGTLCLLDKNTMKLSNEQILQLEAIGREIANKLRSYQLIENKQMQIEDCLQSKKKVAHDIRSPLSGIIGLSQILEHQNIGPLESLQYIQMILQSSRTLLELSDEILSDCRNSELTDPFNLGSLKEQLLKLYAPQTHGKGIHLKIIVLHGENYNVQYKSKLLQIVGNLLSNSIKFTPSGGSIDVVIDWQNALGHQILKIVVSDSGIGMSKEQLDLFHASSLASTPGTQNEGGYGLGLSLVHQLISELNGHLQVHSQPDQGTSFTVILPQAD